MINQPSQQEQTASLTAANTMYAHLNRDHTRLWFFAVLWALLLVGLSLIFGRLTIAAFQRIGADPNTAFLLGVVLHILLGIAKASWQWAIDHRRSPLIYQLGVLLLVGAIIVVAYFRAQLQIELGSPPLVAYLVSAFIALLEIVGPLVVGTLLGNVATRIAKVQRDRTWADQFRNSVSVSLNPLKEWQDEGINLRGRIAKNERLIEEAKLKREQALAQHDHAEARRLEEEIGKAEENIQTYRHQYILLRQHYPGTNVDFDRGVEEALKASQGSPLAVDEP